MEQHFWPGFNPSNIKQSGQGSVLSHCHALKKSIIYSIICNIFLLTVKLRIALDPCMSQELANASNIPVQCNEFTLPIFQSVFLYGHKVVPTIVRKAYMEHMWLYNRYLAIYAQDGYGISVSMQGLILHHYTIYINPLR